MKKNITVFLVLAGLAIVPVTISFLCSGDEADAVTQPAAADDISEEVEVPSPGDTPAAAPRAAASGRTAQVPKAIPLSAAKTAKGVPVFKGFENSRYQQYDAQIKKFVEDFKKNPKKWAGATAGQANAIPELSAAQIKAHMIQETGGGDVNSRTAWAHDPLQVNVPGDWNPYKKYLGLREPRRRNEGSGVNNLKAGLMLLVRKGFGVSGQPAANRPDGAFDGWPRALKRYNGRTDKAATGEAYSDAYSARIRKRAENPTQEVPIPIPTKKRK